MEDGIFYPNKLTKSEIRDLSGWRLKVAVLHFGVGRKYCVDLGYGYKMMRSNYFADMGTVHVVADNNGLWDNPIDLVDEINWDDSSEFIRLCGVNLDGVYKNRITKQLKIKKRGA